MDNVRAQAQSRTRRSVSPAPHLQNGGAATSPAVNTGAANRTPGLGNSSPTEVISDGDSSPLGNGLEDLSLRGALFKRKDFLDKEEGAKSHPNRTYYYRRKTTVDVDKLIESCTRKLWRDKQNGRQLNAKALYIRASCYMKKQKWAAAVSDYTAALSIDENDVASIVSSYLTPSFFRCIWAKLTLRSQYNRGMAYEKLGSVNEAIADFTTVLSVDHNHVNAAYARAACHNRNGSFTAAIDDYNFALLKDQELREGAVAGYAMPPSRRRTGSFAVGVEAYLKKRERELREQELRGFPRGKATVSSPSVNQSPFPRNTVARSARKLTPSQPLLTSVSNGEGTRSQERNAAPESESPESTGKESETEVLHAKGFALRKQGDYKGAILLYTKAIEADPLNFKAYFNRGFAYDKLKNFEAAIRDYTAAIDIDARNAYAYYNRGISHDRSGNYRNAVDDFTMAIDILPSNADFFHNRGFCHRKSGDYESAVKDYTKALELNPNHFKAAYNRAYSQDKLGRHMDAIKDYTTALRIDPSSANALHNRGSSYEKAGQLDRALADFSSAITLDSQNASSYNSRALTYDKLGKHKDAIVDFSRAIALEAGNPVFFHNRGFCYRSMGAFDKAM